MKLFKLTAVIAIAVTAILSYTAVNAASESEIPVDLEINGRYIKNDISPYMKNGTTFAPVRVLCNALGADVEWVEDKVKIYSDKSEIEIKKNSDTASVNGKSVKMSSKMAIHQDRSFVPVRFLAETLGAKVDWDNKYFTVELQKDNHSVSENLKHHSYYEDNIFWLARIIDAESSGEPLRGKVAVGNVILNRVESSEYPDSIYDVIFDRKFGVQFQPVINGSIYNNPSSDSIVAAKRALMGEDIVGECLYFLNPRISTSKWIINNRKYYTTIENHDFYL